MKTRKVLVILVVLLLISGGLFLLRHTRVSAQENPDSTVKSDLQLDIDEGEADTANDSDAQEEQQDIVQGETVSAEEGDPDTGVQEIPVSETLSSDETNEPASEVESIPETVEPENQTPENQGNPGENQNVSSPGPAETQPPSTESQNAPTPETTPETTPESTP